MNDETKALKQQIKALEKRIEKLVKRLNEKRRYEREMLINSGATPAYIAAIDAKDKRALSE